MALSNSQFDAIMRVYNQRQFLNKRRQDERIREVYERIPQVEALTDEIAAAMAQAARRKLQGDEDGARAFKEEASLPLLPGHRLCRRKKMPLLPPDGDPGPL